MEKNQINENSDFLETQWNLLYTNVLTCLEVGLKEDERQTIEFYENYLARSWLTLYLLEQQ